MQDPIKRNQTNNEYILPDFLKIEYNRVVK